VIPSKVKESAACPAELPDKIAGRNEPPFTLQNARIYSNVSGKMPGWRSAVWLYCKFNCCAVYIDGKKQKKVHYRAGKFIQQGSCFVTVPYCGQTQIKW